MSQIGIREYDAKNLRSEFSQTPYEGVLISDQHGVDNVVSSLQSFGDWASFVVKPDQLFGKRGKHGLL